MEDREIPANAGLFKPFILGTVKFSRSNGLLLHSLPEIYRIVRKLKTKVLRWDPVCYNGPDVAARGMMVPHELLIPMKQKNNYHPVERRETNKMIFAAARSDMSYAEVSPASGLALAKKVGIKSFKFSEVRDRASGLWQ